MKLWEITLNSLSVASPGPMQDPPKNIPCLSFCCIWLCSTVLLSLFPLNAMPTPPKPPDGFLLSCMLLFLMTVLEIEVPWIPLSHFVISKPLIVTPFEAIVIPFPTEAPPVVPAQSMIGLEAASIVRPSLPFRHIR